MDAASPACHFGVERGRKECDLERRSTRPIETRDLKASTNGSAVFACRRDIVVWRYNNSAQIFNSSRVGRRNKRAFNSTRFNRHRSRKNLQRRKINPFLLLINKRADMTTTTTFQGMDPGAKNSSR